MTNEKSSAGLRRLDIKKYPNRRYYDATRSRHLTLEEIRALVRDGHDITVTDSKTGADITAQVLTQIILELETPKVATFPVAMLLQMIRANERVVGDFIGNYFEQAFHAYVEYQKQMQERFRHFHAPPGVFGGAASWNPFFASPASGEPGGNEPRTSAQREGDLRATIEELREQVKELQRKKKARKR